MIGMQSIRGAGRRRKLARVVAAGALLMACVAAHGGEADARPGLDRDILPLLKRVA